MVLRKSVTTYSQPYQSGPRNGNGGTPTVETPYKKQTNKQMIEGLEEVVLVWGHRVSLLIKVLTELITEESK